MADTPRQVNAAQAARRKILATKSTRRKDPEREEMHIANSVPLFAPMPGTQNGNVNVFGNGGSGGGGGGGLFGGSVQASGAFNFSAPSLTQMPSYNFSPTAFNSGSSSSSSWGANSMGTDGMGNNNVEDPRADTTGEEAARRNKPFRILGAADTAQSQSLAQSFNNPFQTQSSLRQSSPGVATTSPFQFGSIPATSTAPGGSFSFGTPTKTQEQAGNNIFGGFGGQSQNTQQTTSGGSGFTFGTPPPQEKPASNIFSFGQTQQPASTGAGFGSTPAPATNLFQMPSSTGASFGSTPAPATNLFQMPSSTGASFGSTPAPATNLFQMPSSTGASFGSTPAPAPATNIFQMPSSTGTSFGSIPAPTTSFNFGQPPTTSPAPTTNSIFSSTPITAQASSNIFGQTKPQASNPSNIFAPTQPQDSTVTPNIFGQVKTQPTPGSNVASNNNNPFGPFAGVATPQSIFKNSTQAARSESPSSVFDKEAKENTPPTPNLFGNSTPQVVSVPTEKAALPSVFGATKPPTNIFGASQPGTGSNIFGNKVDTSSGNNLFGTPKTQSSAVANPFATLNQPAPQGVNGNSHSGTANSAAMDPIQANAAPPSSPRPAPASLQANQPSKPPITSSFSFGSVTNGLSPFKQPESVLPSVESDESDRDKRDSTSLFKSNSQPSTSNIFSSMKPVDAPEDAAQPAPRGMFPSLPQPTPSTSNTYSKSNGPSPSKALTNGGGSDQNSEMSVYFAEVDQAADSVIESEIPAHYNEEQRLQFFAAYRTRALNKALKAIVDSGDFTRDYEPVLQHYKQRRDNINHECDTGIRDLKRRRGETVDERDNGSPAKRSKMLTSTSLGQYAVQSPQKPLSSSNGNASPEKRTDSRPNQSPVKSQPFLNGSTTPKAPPPTPKLFAPQSEAPVSPSPRGKRKAEVQITQLDPEGEAVEKQSQKMAKLNGSTGGSQTSNIFKNILDKPAEPIGNTSPKKVFSMTKPSSDEAASPRPNPFASLSIPAASGPPSTPAKSTPFAASTTPAAASNPFAPKTASPSTNMFSKPATAQVPPPNAATSNPFTSKTGSTSSSIFSQTASTPPSFFGSKPSTAPVVSSPLAKGPSTADDLSSKKAPVAGATTLKPPMFGSGSTSTPTSTTAIKPPTFGTPVNFLAQFGSKASKSAAERELEEMEKAKMEDMDSDEDEAEWEAAYKEKRKASRAELKRIAETGQRFSVSDTSGSETEKPKSAAKSIFGHASTTSAPSGTLFPPIPRSGASSPGLMSSNGSSVFDGLTANKPVTFGDNIFGHLSDVDSGADSGRGNDADDDTDESRSEEDDEEDEREEPDDETKDATYDPKISEPAVPSTPGTPTTPVEKTGEGIASTKKSKVPFTFSGTPSNSGTTTPGGSIFDRITRDADGNPVRQLPTDDKENAGPSTSSIFGTNTAATNSLLNFSKSPAADSTKSPPGDNTWKPDTPIKFGASAAAPTFTFGSTPSTPPAVTIQAPTPTKANPFGSLFGSTTAPKSTTPASGSGAASPFAGLFGSTAAPKPSTPSIFSNLGGQDKPAAVGFNFGGPSTVTSSLFPSAAASGVTSRATTPGGTTDGESANEANGGNDEPPMAQIDLASGGAGEEDEDNVFEVRAKAQRFEPSKDNGGANAWVVKGLGQFKILKHKETGKSRMLLRADPSGTVVLNKRILPVNYAATQKTVKLMVSDDTGKGIETWLLQVKTPESAKELAESLEKNKASA